jgi:mannose-6-phosphate isomerase-like protein (cupin superfamily)
MNISRREACALLPALCAALSASSSENDALKSAAYPFESLPVSKESEATYRDILEGRTRTGDYLEAHETVLEAGAMPHPAHRHVGEELFLISSGKLEATIAGKKTVLGPGSAFFVASNEEHALRNIGAVPAQYFVITLGQKAS